MTNHAFSKSTSAIDQVSRSISNGIPETPTSLTVNGRVVAWVNRYQPDWEKNAVQYLVKMGWIISVEQIADIRMCKADNNIDIWITCPLPNHLDLLSPQHLEDWND